MVGGGFFCGVGVLWFVEMKKAPCHRWWWMARGLMVCGVVGLFYFYVHSCCILCSICFSVCMMKLCSVSRIEWGSMIFSCAICIMMSWFGYLSNRVKMVSNVSCCMPKSHACWNCFCVIFGVSFVVVLMCCSAMSMPVCMSSRCWHCSPRMRNGHCPLGWHSWHCCCRICCMSIVCVGGGVMV